MWRNHNILQMPWHVCYRGMWKISLWPNTHKSCIRGNCLFYKINARTLPLFVKLFRGQPWTGALGWKRARYLTSTTDIGYGQASWTVIQIGHRPDRDRSKLSATGSGQNIRNCITSLFAPILSCKFCSTILTTLITHSVIKYFEGRQRNQVPSIFECR